MLGYALFSSNDYCCTGSVTHDCSFEETGSVQYGPKRLKS